MKSVFFCNLLIVLVVVFIQAKPSKPKKYTKTSDGQCVEYKYTREKSRPKLYSDKTCSTLIKIQKRRSGARNESVSKKRPKSKKMAESTKKANSSRPSSSSTVLRKKPIIRKDSANARRPSNAAISKKTSMPKDSVNARRPSNAAIRKKTSSTRKGSVNATVSKQKKGKNRSSTKTIKKPLNETAQKFAEKSRNLKHTTRNPIVKKRVVVKRSGELKKKVKSEANAQNETQWPVAIEERSKCYLTFRNGTRFLVRNGCRAIKKPHFYLHPSARCYKVLNDETKTTQLVDLARCDLPNKYPRYVPVNKKCVYKFLTSTKSKSFTTMKKCRDNQSKMNKKKRTKQETGVPGGNGTVTVGPEENVVGSVSPGENGTTTVPTRQEGVVSVSSGGNGAMTVPPPDDEVTTTVPPGTDGSNEGSGSSEEPTTEEEYDTTEEDTTDYEDYSSTSEAITRRLPLPQETRHSPKSKCVLRHGAYTGKCIDAKGFLNYASQISLIDLDNFDLGRASGLASRVFDRVVKTNDFSLSGLINLGGQGVKFFQGDNPLEGLTSLTSKIGDMEYCELIGQYSFLKEQHYRNFITAC